MTAIRAPHTTKSHDKQLLHTSYIAASIERSRSPQHASTALLVAARSAALAARASPPMEVLGNLKGILRNKELRYLQGGHNSTQEACQILSVVHDTPHVL
jgi:hypothetical protein